MANLEKVKEFFRNDLFATQVSGILIEQVDYHFALCKSVAVVNVTGYVLKNNGKKL